MWQVLKEAFSHRKREVPVVEVYTESSGFEVIDTCCRGRESRPCIAPKIITLPLLPTPVTACLDNGQASDTVGCQPSDTGMGEQAVMESTVGHAMLGDVAHISLQANAEVA